MPRYDPEFNPLLREEQTALLLGTGIPQGGLAVRCVACGALPEYVHDFGTLTAQSWDTDNQITDLLMNPWEIAQYRIRVINDFKIQLKNPAPTPQWRTRDANFYLPQFPMSDGDDFLRKFYWCQSEFFVFEDNGPRFDVYSDQGLTASRALFSGWRMRVAKLEDNAEPPKVTIWLSEWPTTLSSTRR